MLRRLGLLTFAFGSLTLPLQAIPTIGTVGTSAGQFLKLGAGARAVGMGEAYTAAAAGSDAIYWNPAGLERVEARDATFMHSMYLADISYDFASYAQRLGPYSAMGLGMQYVNAREFEQTDAAGNNMGTYQPDDLALSLGYARRWRRSGGQDFLTLGLAGKFIRSRVVETAQTGAADLGFLWSVTPKMSLGAAAQNLGGPLKYKDVSNPLPMFFRAGAAYRVNDRVMFDLDGQFPRDYAPSAAVGTEFRKPLSEELWMSGRLGFNSRTLGDIRGLNAITAGMGLSWEGYSFDFAWVPYGAVGTAYRFSLSAKFGRKGT